MLSFKQREAARRILGNDQSSIAACWFASFLVSGYTVRGQRDNEPDPETIYIDDADQEAFLLEVERAGEIAMTDLVRAKSLAGLAIYSTDQIYAELPAFIDLANLTNAEDPPVPNVFNPANVLECGLALVEIGMVDTDLTSEAASRLGDRFSREIRGYWGAVLSSEGAAGPVPPFMSALMREPDPLGDPMLFDAMAGRTEAFAKSLRENLWSYAVTSFNQIVTLTDSSGQPIVAADQMQQFMTALAGSN